MSVADRIREETEHSKEERPGWKNDLVGEFILHLVYADRVHVGPDDLISVCVLSAFTDDELEVMYAQWVLERES